MPRLWPIITTFCWLLRLIVVLCLLFCADMASLVSVMGYSPAGTINRVIWITCEITIFRMLVKSCSLLASKKRPTQSNDFFHSWSKPTPIIKGFKIIPLRWYKCETAHLYIRLKYKFHYHRKNAVKIKIKKSYLKLNLFVYQW